MTETKETSLNHYVHIQQTWTITEAKLREMAMNAAEMTRNIDSEKTEVATMPNVKYFIRICKQTMQSGHYEFASYLFLSEAAEAYRIHGKFSFFVKSANYFTQFDDVFDKTWFGWGDTICPFDEFFNAKRKFIVDGLFTVEMKGILIFEVKQLPKITVIEASPLVQELWRRDDKDFKIVVGDEGNVMFQKTVLCARSTYFEGLFRSGMQESFNNSVNIIDFNLKTVKTAVEFFYDQNIFESLNFDDAFELLRFADKYQIADLQDKLELHLTYQLSPSTVCKIANGSIYSNSAKLRQICFDFLMCCSKHGISVENLENLDKEFAAELFRNTFNL